MPTVLQFRRGTASQNNSFTGAAGEISIDTTAQTLRVHDNSTVGGSIMVSVNGTQTVYNKSFPYISGTTIIGGSGNLVANATTVSTSTTTGALVVPTGGVGIGGALWVGAGINSANIVNGTSNIAIASGGAITLGVGSANVVAFGSSGVVPAANITTNIGNSTNWFNIIYGNTFLGRSTSASYADLAENYSADAEYAPGTVLVFGGEKEVTVTTTSHDTCVAGVVSTNPAYLMNSDATGVPVALTGRVPCQVQGPVNKGTVLVTSTTPGVAQAIDNQQFKPGCILGKALESINTNSIETIEVVVGVR